MTQWETLIDQRRQWQSQPPGQCGLKNRVQAIITQLLLGPLGLGNQANDRSQRLKVVPRSGGLNQLALLLQHGLQPSTTY